MGVIKYGALACSRLWILLFLMVSCSEVGSRRVPTAGDHTFDACCRHVSSPGTEPFDTQSSALHSRGLGRGIVQFLATQGGTHPYMNPVLSLLLVSSRSPHAPHFYLSVASFWRRFLGLSYHAMPIYARLVTCSFVGRLRHINCESPHRVGLGL